MASSTTILRIVQCHVASDSSVAQCAAHTLAIQCHSSNTIRLPTQPATLNTPIHTSPSLPPTIATATPTTNFANAKNNAGMAAHCGTTHRIWWHSICQQHAGTDSSIKAPCSVPLQSTPAANPRDVLHHLVLEEYDVQLEAATNAVSPLAQGMQKQLCACHCTNLLSVEVAIIPQ